MGTQPTSSGRLNGVDERKRGLTLHTFDELADPYALADLATSAESSGWHGFFLWDHIHYREPVEAVCDPWIALAAVAMRTTTIRIGQMVTPLARRRVHVVARQVVALDQLSHGRMICGFGLGLDSSGREFSSFGEQLDVRTRAEIYDESLAVFSQLLTGERVTSRGRHVVADNVRFLPKPVQSHLPIWIAGRWPNRQPLRRASDRDGLFLIDAEPEQVREAKKLVESMGSPNGFDLITHVRPTVSPQQFFEAGATWVLTTFDPFATRFHEVLRFIEAGPNCG